MSIEDSTPTHTAEDTAEDTIPMESMTTTEDGTAHDITIKEDSTAARPLVDSVESYQFILDCSSGHLQKVSLTLVNSTPTTRQALVNASDDDGTPALNYAIMLGHFEIAKLLIANGADPLKTDSKGRDAFRWAKRSANPLFLKLLENPGEADFEIADDMTDAMTDNTTERADNDHHDTTQIENTLDQTHITEPTTLDQKQPPALLSIPPSTSSSSSTNPNPISRVEGMLRRESIREDDEVSTADSNISSFDWNSAKATEMIPFDPDDAAHVLNVAIRTIVPSKKSKFQPLGANVLFLCARYACYHTSVELANVFLSGAVRVIRIWVRENTPTMNSNNTYPSPSSPATDSTYPMMASACRLYWISNAHQLLVYLKRDGRLVSETINPQLELSQLLEELLTSLLKDMDAHVASIVGPSLVEHNADESLLENHFFGLTNRTTSVLNTLQSQQSRSNLFSNLYTSSLTLLSAPSTHSPSSITTLYTILNAALTAANIHPQLRDQLEQRLTQSVSHSLIPSILSRACSKSRAQQVMMHLSDIQPIPRAQVLLKFITVVGTVHSVSSLVDLQKATGVEWGLVKRVLEGYRYEKGEQTLSEAVLGYARRQSDGGEEELGEVFVPMRGGGLWEIEPVVPKVVREILNQTSL